MSYGLAFRINVAAVEFRAASALVKRTLCGLFGIVENTFRRNLVMGALAAEVFGVACKPWVFRHECGPFRHNDLNNARGISARQRAKQAVPCLPAKRKSCGAMRVIFDSASFQNISFSMAFAFVCQCSFVASVCCSQ